MGEGEVKAIKRIKVTRPLAGSSTSSRMPVVEAEGQCVIPFLGLS